MSLTPPLPSRFQIRAVTRYSLSVIERALTDAVDAMRAAKLRADQAWNGQRDSGYYAGTAETMYWIVAADDCLRHRFPGYGEARNKDMNGQIVLGLHAVRNFVIHQLVEIYQEIVGRTYPRKYPWGYVRHAIWRPFTDADLGNTYEPAKRAYVDKVAGRPVDITLEAAIDFISVQESRLQTPSFRG